MNLGDYQKLIERAADEAIATGEPQVVQCGLGEEAVFLLVCTQEYAEKSRPEGEEMPKSNLVSSDGVRLLVMRMPGDVFEGLNHFVQIDGVMLWRPVHGHPMDN